MRNMEEQNELGQKISKTQNEMSEEEKRIWYDLLKYLPPDYPFVRNKTVEGYTVDFFCGKTKTAIYLVEASRRKPEEVQRDNKLKSCGVTVLRYTLADINENFKSVSDDLLKRIGLRK